MVQIRTIIITQEFISNKDIYPLGNDNCSYLQYFSVYSSAIRGQRHSLIANCLWRFEEKYNNFVQMHAC